MNVPEPYSPAGVMPIGARLTVRAVSAVTQDGQLYRLSGAGGIWEEWRITATEAVLVARSRNLWPPTTQRRVADWAYLTHLQLARVAKENAAPGGTPDAA